MSNSIFLLIFAAFLGTYLTRILAFFVFKNKKESTGLNFVQKNMPLMIIVILFFYTFYGINFKQSPFGVDFILACLFVFFLHLKFKNALLSIVSGTLFYIILLRILA